MEQSKYYTPDESDIRVGMEYEIEYDEMAGLWEKSSIDNLYDMETFAKHNCKYIGKYCNYRIPYLTEDQIEAEGWKFKATNNIRWWYEKDDVFFECPMTTGYQIMRLEMMHDPEYKAITIRAYYRGEAGYDKGDGVDLPKIYEGYCPSINEFRIITKLLNIK